jgi:4,5-DOPA dioxygenase extradiol
MAEFPTLFLSHGAPNLTLHANPAREFLSGLGAEIGKPQAIIILSSHFESQVPSFLADEKPGMLYSFNGFEAELYKKVYAAPRRSSKALGFRCKRSSRGVSTMAPGAH